MSVVPVFCLFAAVLYLFAARTYEADLKFAEGAVPAPGGRLEPQPA
jgi:hypothetical protein